MSPRNRGGWFEAKPRIAVQGGVVVAKPGRVTDPAALDIVHAAQIETSATILSRARTYARAGQVVGLQADEQGITATIQGSSRTPYQVRLSRVVISGTDRIDATCSCPYGCDHGWCKHAAALAYVAAFLVDTQPATRAVWTGQETAAGLEELDDAQFEILRSAAPSMTFAERLAAAAEIVPWEPIADEPPRLALVHDASAAEHQSDASG